MKHFLVILFLLISIFTSAKPNESEISTVKWYEPDLLKFNHGGGLGYIGVGIGKQMLWKHVQTSLFYGYTPKSVAGENLHDIAWHVNVLLFKVPVKNIVTFQPVLGIYRSYTITPNSDKTFIKLPSKYPDNYYPQNAARLNFSVGFLAKKEFNNSLIKAADFNFSWVTNDLYVQYWWNDRDDDIRQFFYLSMGVCLYR